MSNEVIFKNLKEYKGGWFIGAFNPSILFTKDFEVAIFYIKKGTVSDNHYHLWCDEYNVITDGECLVTSNGIKHKLSNGDIFHFPKGVRTNVKYTKDTTLVIIKTPSIPGDKHYLDKENDEG